jgi:hypothetical protein
MLTKLKDISSMSIKIASRVLVKWRFGTVEIQVLSEGV